MKIFFRTRDASPSSLEQEKQLLLNELVEIWQQEIRELNKLQSGRNKFEKKDEKKLETFFENYRFQKLYMELFDITFEMIESNADFAMHEFFAGIIRRADGAMDADSSENLARFLNNRGLFRTKTLRERFGHFLHYTGEKPKSLNFLEQAERSRHELTLKQMADATGKSIIFWNRVLQEGTLDASNTEDRERAGMVMQAMINRLLIMREYMRMAKLIQDDKLFVSPKLQSKLRFLETSIATMLEGEKFKDIGSFIKISVEVHLKQETEYKDSRDFFEILNKVDARKSGQEVDVYADDKAIEAIRTEITKASIPEQNIDFLNNELDDPRSYNPMLRDFIRGTLQYDLLPEELRGELEQCSVSASGEQIRPK